MGSKLNLENTFIHDLKIITPHGHKDHRGEFSRVFCKEELSDVFDGKDIKQINHSITKEKGAVRGLHFQYPPNCEIKFVKCIKGKVLDIVVDIRKDSPTFLQHLIVELSPINQKMIYIPKGFAHGFQVLESDSELLYLHSEFYTQENEGALNIVDPLLNITLTLSVTDISQRDKEHPFINKEFKGI